MSIDLEQRLQEALDAERLSDELLKEVGEQPELEAMIELDAALRSMPHAEFDLSDGILAHLDDEFEEIPGLFDAPQFDEDSSASGSFEAPPTTPAPISLDDARRKRSAAPFLIAAAAVIGLVGVSTLMTLNRPFSDQMAMESAVSQVAPLPMAEPSLSAAPSPRAAPPTVARTLSGLPEGNYAEEEMTLEVLAEPRGNSVVEAPEAEEDRGDVLAALSERNQEEPRDLSLVMPSAAAPARMAAVRSARGGSPAPVSLTSPTSTTGAENEDLSPSQQRTLARIESCLPDHVRITRVRQSTDGRRVVGVETSEELPETVDECVSGVLDVFPRARRRRSSMSSHAIMRLDD